VNDVPASVKLGVRALFAHKTGGFREFTDFQDEDEKKYGLRNYKTGSEFSFSFSSIPLVCLFLRTICIYYDSSRFALLWLCLLCYE